MIGEKEALDFILSILREADGKAINNGKGSFVPSDKLKNHPDDLEAFRKELNGEKFYSRVIDAIQKSKDADAKIRKIVISLISKIG